MELKSIKEDITQLKLSNKKNKFMIEQLKFIGATPIKESRCYTYFNFNGDIPQTAKMLGLSV